MVKQFGYSRCSDVGDADVAAPFATFAVEMFNGVSPVAAPATAAAAAALLSPVVVLVVAVHETQARQMILRIARRLARVQCRLRGHAAAAPTPDASSDAPDGPWSAEIQQTRPDRAFLVH